MSRKKKPIHVFLHRDVQMKLEDKPEFAGTPKWYIGPDGIKRWLSNDQPCDKASERAMWKCTQCGRIGLVGRCCGIDTREPVEIDLPEITTLGG
jgi:hypothetical protein